MKHTGKEIYWAAQTQPCQVAARIISYHYYFFYLLLILLLTTYHYYYHLLSLLESLLKKQKERIEQVSISTTIKSSNSHQLLGLGLCYAFLHYIFNTLYRSSESSCLILALSWCQWNLSFLLGQANPKRCFST